MQITLATQPFATIETEALVTYVFEDADVRCKAGLRRSIRRRMACSKNWQRAASSRARPLEMTLVHAPAGLKAARLLLVGAGKREKFDATALRKIAGAALRYLKSRGVHNFVFAARENGATEDTAQAITEGAIAADFESDKYKTDKKNDKSIESIQIAGYSDGERAAGEKGLTRGRIIAESQNFARDLINEPSNKLTPEDSGGKSRSHGQSKPDSRWKFSTKRKSPT